MATSLINDRILEEALKNIKAYIDTNSDSSKNVSTEINDLMSQVNNISEEIKNITLESLGGIEEAPNDEFYYLRKNKEWVKIEKIEQDTPVQPDPEDPEDPDPEDPDEPKEPEIPDYYARISTSMSDPSALVPASGGTGVKHYNIFVVSYWKNLGYTAEYSRYEADGYAGTVDSVTENEITITFDENPSRNNRHEQVHIYANIYDGDGKFVIEEDCGATTIVQLGQS